KRMDNSFNSDSIDQAMRLQQYCTDLWYKLEDLKFKNPDSTEIYDNMIDFIKNSEKRDTVEKISNFMNECKKISII
ncbi:MAG: hypothetical protein Q8K60_07385, partial [Parachlamydiaceae bacterium]|nr:hypothetical protein [Parachlamydiaceae bacterium]